MKDARLGAALALALLRALWFEPAQAQDNAGYDVWTGERITELEQRVRREPHNAVVHMRLACALAEAGRVREAARVADAALRLEPGRGAFWHNRAWIHELQGNLDQALSMYRRAAELEPRLTVARAGMALLLCRMNHAAEGLPLLEALLAEQPADRKLRQNAAVAALQVDQPSRALAHARRLVGPDLTARDRRLLCHALSELADSLLRVGAAERALSLADSALALDAQWVRAYALQARAHLYRQRLAAAEEAVRMALRLEPERCDALGLLVQVLARRGDAAAADSVSALAEAACLRQVTAGSQGPVLEWLDAERRAVAPDRAGSPTRRPRP